MTLVEMLVAIAIAIILLGMALPVWRELAERNRSAAAINQFIGAVALSRSAAVDLHSPVTLCPGTPTGGCGPRDSWDLGALLFIDANRNGQIDSGEQILRALPALPAGSRIMWRSFRNRSYLQFNPTGLTHWQNGTVQYCPGSGDTRFARAAIINAQGRVRLAPDSDGDGIAEDASGRPLQCP